ncbi:MAG: hypothetical protein ACYC61_22170 [Isosphaeraceae bacterium]
MASLSVHSSARARSGRPRRRRLFLAEVLETRRLLSVSVPAMPHAVVSAPLVPALVGPMTSSAGTSSPAAGAHSLLGSGQPAPQLVIPIDTINFNVGNLNETLVIVEFSGNIGGASPASYGSGASTATLGPIATFSGITGDTSSASLTAATDTSGPTAQTPAITPLTATILSGPAVGGRAVVVIIAPQPLVANLGPSTIPATEQAILATATLEEQPLGPPVLGQGFESPVGQGFESLFGPNLMSRPAHGWINLELPGADFVEPIDATPMMPQPDAPAPDQPAVPVPTDASAVSEILLDPVAMSDWGKMPASPILTSELDAASHDESPTWSLAAMIGTTAIATGGYQLVLGGSARFNQRWLPTRRSSGRRKAVIR